MKSRFFLCLVSAVAAVAVVCDQSQSNGAETGGTKSGPSSLPAAGLKSPDASTRPPVTIQVQATTSIVLPGQKVLLAAKTSGADPKDLEWSLAEGETAGSIRLSADYPDATRSGPLWVYTASNTPGTYHVITKAPADPQNSVTTRFVVQPFVNGCSPRSDEVGVWQNITPSQVDLTRGDYFGMQAIVIDPINPSTIYTGRAMDGIYKSTDCGANWKKVSTGRNSRTMASGRSWTMVIDRSNPQIIYTNQGYGAGGVYKTTNGGVDWDQVLTPNITTAVPYGGFVGAISMNPDNPRHLLVGWHSECPPPRSKACFAETTDGGSSWVLRDGNPSWAGGEGTHIEVLKSKTWMFTSQTNGLWLSKDDGATWQQSSGFSISHGRGQLYRAKDGSFYLGTVHGVAHSVDGFSWKMLPASGSLVMGLVGDGKTLFSSKAFPYGPPGADPYLPYFSSPEQPPRKFAPMNSPMIRNGGAELHFDATRNILYSTNLDAGLWRLVTK